MKKIINISGKEYSMKASAFTQFAYKNETGRSLLKDITHLSEVDMTETEHNTDLLDEITEIVLKLAYVLAQEDGSNNLTDYNSFLKDIDNLYDDQQWIEDVILLATSPLSRRLQENQN